ncbi:hypothetical protein EBZ38_04385 [bacterium]|nr:hypothetical protein [bacterium]
MCLKYLSIRKDSYQPRQDETHLAKKPQDTKEVVYYSYDKRKMTLVCVPNDIAITFDHRSVLDDIIDQYIY